MANRAYKIGSKINNVADILDAAKLKHSICIYKNQMDSADIFMNKIADIRDKGLKINFPILSEKEKELYLNRIQSDYDALYNYTSLRKNNAPEFLERAFNTALMIKGMLLKSSTAMRNNILRSKDSTLINEYKQWISLKKKIAKRYAQGLNTENLEEKAISLERNLVKKSNEFSAYSAIQNNKWTDIKKGLKPNETAIEFVKFNKKNNPYLDSSNNIIYAALIIQHDSDHPEMIELFQENKLENIIGQFPGNNISYIKELYDSDNSKSQLYNLIWQPLEDELANTKRVILSPVGLLHKISFAALSKSHEIYLCDMYDIEMKSSTRKVLKDDDGKFDFDQVALFGGIEYTSSSKNSEVWSYLEGTMEEVTSIEKILNKKKSIMISSYTKSKGKESLFKETANEHQIIHLATHGYFFPEPDKLNQNKTDTEELNADLVFRGNSTSYGYNTFVTNKNPLMRSGLVMAGANDSWNSDNNTSSEDGILTAEEVANIDLRKNELIVLSACETGLGDIKGSEGVYGLQRAFKMAGSRYLIMSLWKVPDKETAQFMTSFYKKLLKTNDIKKAFNDTQRKMRSKYAPYYWAAFVLIE